MAIPQLHLRQGRADRAHRRMSITPKSAGWNYVGFELYRLPAGECAAANTGANEICIVFISGRGVAKAGQEYFGLLGGRMSPFDGRPWAFYIPAGTEWSVAAETDLEIAVCAAPGVKGSRPPRVIGPESHTIITRGKGDNLRHVTDIINEMDEADGLLVLEVITPAGNVSSYPPHKHDRDAFPEETQLEEVYYHRINPPQGFALQRIYTDDRTLDVSMTLEDGDVTLVPCGYHPCAALYGYDLYYLNVMAGPVRMWRFHNDPAHEWILSR
jgi:5-deoxy-glucuronate isomerase